MSDEERVEVAIPSSKQDNPTPYRSLATMMDDEITSQMQTAGDPTSSFTRKEEQLTAAERRELNKHAIPSMDGNKVQRGRVHTMPTLSGHADAAFAAHGLTIGARVYHKIRKKEGSVVDMAASGKIKVEFDDNQIGWQNASNLVKL